MPQAVSLEQIAPQPLRPDQLPPATARALYIHVPFCFHKCHYCDFYSITRQTPERMDRFVDRVLQEARQWSDGRHTPWRNRPSVRPRTIFFGGGTPSLLPVETMRRLLVGIHDLFDLSECSEWTVEVNPATASVEYCTMLRAHGVNRLSIGAQSFDRAQLALLERHHDPDAVPSTVEMARTAGFQAINLDLIYAIPGQDLASWRTSLTSAMQLQTRHLSCYGLTYEPNTPLAVRRRLGKVQAAAESLELEMLHETQEILTAWGRPAYEISNYAVPGQECKHNLLYWTGGDYIGLGPAAASHIAGWRWRNRPHLGEWELAIDNEQLPAIEVETLSPRQRAGELAMLMLRLSRGIVLDDFAARCGFAATELWGELIGRLTHLGLLAVDTHSIRLTPAGIDVADSIAAEFLADVR